MPYAEPAGDTEHTVAEIWQAVLGIDAIGRNDALADLGGDSLIAIQIAARVRESCAVNMTVKSVFEDATVAGMARTIEAMRWHSGQKPKQALASGEEEGIL